MFAVMPRLAKHKMSNKSNWKKNNQSFMNFLKKDANFFVFLLDSRKIMLGMTALYGFGLKRYIKIKNKIETKLKTPISLVISIIICLVRGYHALNRLR